MSHGPFGDPAGWPQADLIGSSGLVGPDVVVAAYRSGVFPMPHGRRLAWYSPLERGILPLDRLRVTRSLRRSAAHYRVRTDSDFAGVIAGCGDPHRPFGWIDRWVRGVYTALFEAGIVHSVEVLDADDRLVGGLYGVQLGGLFAGESMFHDPEHGRDASKVALIELIRILSADGIAGRLLDVQWRTDHLASLGVVEVARADYLARLPGALALPSPPWPSDG